MLDDAAMRNEAEERKNACLVDGYRLKIGYALKTAMVATASRADGNSQGSRR